LPVGEGTSRPVSPVKPDCYLERNTGSGNRRLALARRDSTRDSADNTPHYLSTEPQGDAVSTVSFAEARPRPLGNGDVRRRVRDRARRAVAAAALTIRCCIATSR